MRRSVVESNGAAVTKQLVLGNLVGKHRLCFKGSRGLIERVSSRAHKKKQTHSLNRVTFCVSAVAFQENWVDVKALIP